MAVLERRREIGIMKALGASDADVRGLFFAEAGVMGLFGGAFGVALGLPSGASSISASTSTSRANISPRHRSVGAGCSWFSPRSYFDRCQSAVGPLPGVPSRATRSGAGPALRVNSFNRRSLCLSLFLVFLFSQARAQGRIDCSGLKECDPRRDRPLLRHVATRL